MLGSQGQRHLPANPPEAAVQAQPAQQARQHVPRASGSARNIGPSQDAPWAAQAYMPQAGAMERPEAGAQHTSGSKGSSDALGEVWPPSLKLHSACTSIP
jgi:hypothetical protein